MGWEKKSDLAAQFSTSDKKSSGNGGFIKC